MYFVNVVMQCRGIRHSAEMVECRIAIGTVVDVDAYKIEDVLRPDG